MTSVDESDMLNASTITNTEKIIGETKLEAGSET